MLRDLIFCAVVLHAVIKHQFHVLAELMDIIIDIESQFLLNCSEIHRLFDYFEVVHDSVFAWVDWFMKKVSAF